MNEPTDTQVALLVKEALEYNAGLIVLATAYYGSLADNPSARRRFVREVEKTQKQYGERIKEILGINETTE